jgi:recombinational DNA repair ATPase RecF
MDLLIKNGVGQFEIMAETAFGSVFLSFDGEKKTIELDGDKLKAQSLKKIFNIVSYTPNYELSLATESSIRTYIDKLACSIFPDHEKLISQAKELLYERTKILLTSGNASWLSSVEEQIAQIITVIFYNRLSFVQKIQDFFNLLNINCKIDAGGNCMIMLQNQEKFAQIEGKIMQILEKSRVQDKDAGKSTNIANEVCYEIAYNGVKIEYCSSGQQKLVGALVAVASGFCAKQIRNNVIVLLDDITAKIDDANQEYLHTVIEYTQCQTVVSTILQPHY